MEAPVPDQTEQEHQVEEEEEKPKKIQTKREEK